ncbi:MAG: hypothetical protein QM651_01055 [Rhodoblastus sp.]
MSTNVLIEISGHGFGHLMQIMPVAAALQKRLPDFEISVRSSLAPERLRHEVAKFGRFQVHCDAAPDFHPRMRNSYSVDTGATIEACRGAFDAFETLVAAEQHFLDRGGFDLVVSDISPLPLAAAQRSGVPNVALCSLDWAATLAFIPDLAAPLQDVIERLRGIYNECDLFLRPAPHIGCAGASNCRPLGHIARIGANRRGEIGAAFGIDPDARLVMVSSGGMDGFPFAIDIPKRAGLFWVLPDGLGAPAADRQPVSALARWAYIDILASLDVLVAKPGYGLIVEAVANGVPVASLERNGWVDVASLEAWGGEHGALCRIGMADIRTGAWAADVERLAWGVRPKPYPPTGAEEAVERIASLLQPA